MPSSPGFLWEHKPGDAFYQVNYMEVTYSPIKKQIKTNVKQKEKLVQMNVPQSNQNG